MGQASDNTKHGPSPRDPNVRGHVYLIVNDQNPRRLKVGFTLKDPLSRARDLVSTGTNGTFVVIYQALVNGPKSVEDDVHERLSDHRREGEWFEIDADTAVTTIRRCAGAIHYESTEARWPSTQADPQPFVMEMVAEARRTADARREQEALAREANRLEDERRREEESRRASEQQLQTAQRRQPAPSKRQRSGGRGGWRTSLLFVAFPIAMSLFVVVGMLRARTTHTQQGSTLPLPPIQTLLTPSSQFEVESQRRENLRLNDAFLEARNRLSEAEGRLKLAQHTLETLPGQLQSLRSNAIDHDRAIKDAERTLAASRAENLDFMNAYPDFSAAAQQEAEKAESAFIDRLVADFLADEDAIAARTGRPMHPQGIENNINRIRTDAEPDAIRVFNGAFDKAMARLKSESIKLAGLVRESKQRLDAAREAKAADDARPSTLVQKLKLSQQELVDARALVVTRRHELRLAETAIAVAREDLRKAEEATGGRAFSQGQVVPAKSIAPPPPSSRVARPRKT